MNHSVVEMIDAVFDISGETLPGTYPFALWQALTQRVPEIETDDLVGVLPLRTSASASGMLLPKRAKLVLRLPAHFTAHIARLEGQPLAVDDITLRLGNIKLRAIQPYPTLHAHLVTGDADEHTFMQHVAARLTELGILGKLICGMRHRMDAPDRTIHGYSLVVHDLKPDASLRLQYTGLGADRRYGCGIFVPYKAITHLD